MSPEWQICFYLVAIALFLVAAWRIRIGRPPAQEFGWVGLAVLTVVPLWAAIQAT